MIGSYDDVYRITWEYQAQFCGKNRLGAPFFSLQMLEDWMHRIHARPWTHATRVPEGKARIR